MKILNETLDYGDFKGEMEPTVSVDEYSAKMGKDKDIVTLAFIVNSKQCGEDLTSWLETGYDFVLDADVSDGEVDNGKYLVFAEMNRRSTVPERIIEMLEDLQGLTGFKLDDWTVKVDDKKYDADKDQLKDAIILIPKDYARMQRREEKAEQEELNQMRDIAGLERPVDTEVQEPVAPPAEPAAQLAAPPAEPAAAPAPTAPASPAPAPPVETPPAAPVAEQKDLNNMRQLAGLDTKKVYNNVDEELKKYIRMAGL